MESFLIVDDDTRLSAVYKFLIRVKFKNAFIRCAENGVEALKIAEESDFSVLISDVNMPEMDGLTLHKKLKKQQPFLAERTIFITGNADSSNLSYFEKENRPYLIKPFNPVALYDCIDRVFGG